MTPRSGHLLGLGPHGFHRLGYVEWGDPGRDRTLVCAHGLTRNSRDFDALAQALTPEYRVVCPDMPGRGTSEWLSHPEDYSYPVYLGDAAALLAQVGADEVDWLGTSMGGLIGLLLAAQPNTPIRRLVLNDVGPFLPKDALARIAAYVGTDPRFGTLEEAEGHLRQVHAPFGALTDEQWRQLALHSTRKLDGGGFALHYDPAIAVAFRAAPLQDVMLWPMWYALQCPVLVLRGENSDLLSRETAEAMRASRPGKVTVVEIPGTGHAPSLMADDQIEVVRRWLLETT